MNTKILRLEVFHLVHKISFLKLELWRNNIASLKITRYHLVSTGSKWHLPSCLNEEMKVTPAILNYLKKKLV